MRYFIIILALLASFGARADWLGNPEAVGIHVATKHYPYDKFKNEVNPGAYVRTDKGYIFGTYVNSEYTQSAYFGKRFWEWGPLSAQGMLVTGYKDHAILPVIVPSLKVASLGGFNVSISGIPKVGPINGMLHLSFELEIK